MPRSKRVRSRSRSQEHRVEKRRRVEDTDRSYNTRYEGPDRESGCLLPAAKEMGNYNSCLLSGNNQSVPMAVQIESVPMGKNNIFSYCGRVGSKLANPFHRKDWTIWELSWEKRGNVICCTDLSRKCSLSACLKIFFFWKPLSDLPMLLIFVAVIVTRQLSIILFT